GHRTMVKPFPISVDFPPARDVASIPSSIYLDRAMLLRELGVDATFVGVGIDRVDYTKGIQERFLAIERMLEKRPTYEGKFVFVQLGAPSRTHIKRYTICWLMSRLKLNALIGVSRLAPGSR